MSGHIIDMVNRIKQNSLPTRKKFQGDNRSMLFHEGSSVTYDFPNPTSEKLEAIKSNIREKASQEQRKSFLILAICIAVMAVLITLFLINYNYRFSTLV
ncbi:hypothetical protein [Euzebyella saccharophila]|uniref:Uncharacterized protein n=1 Tax=Euzebyella saccharophila TaxID=679664 RepID=A0ABV8JPW9_9FLAO|nr:hypothetical protein [Euzebyella saccharophila]